MSKAKHTPAPWYAERPNGSNGYHYVNNEDNKLGRIACCYATVADNLNDNESEVAANARLIAASPEMYELLKSFISAVPTDGTWNYAACVDKAIRIIKKIEG